MGDGVPADANLEGREAVAERRLGVVAPADRWIDALDVALVRGVGPNPVTPPAAVQVADRDAGLPATKVVQGDGQGRRGERVLA